MAEEEPLAEEQDKAGGKSSGLVRNIIIAGIIILVPAILALVIYNFIISPIVAGNSDAEAPPEKIETIPAEAMSFVFPEAQATVLSTESDVSSPLLIYQVALVCADQATWALVEAKQTWFESLINKLHRNRTRQELNDPVVQETILKQSKQEANQLLRKFNPGGTEEILEVMHVKFAIFEL
jgi:flagellar basal body-associated protein FliL